MAHAPGPPRSTPGPWHVEEGHGAPMVFAGRREIAQARLWMGSEDAALAQANARLIASAPDLLEACQALMRSINNAIVLGEYSAEDRNRSMQKKIEAELDAVRDLADAAIAKATHEVLPCEHTWSTERLGWFRCVNCGEVRQEVSP